MATIHDWLSSIINGGVSIFNFYLLFRIMTMEKENIRRESGYNRYTERNDREVKDVKNRLLDIEMELSKRFSTWGKRYDT